MSHPQPPQRQPTSAETQAYARAIHNTALAAMIVCPVLVLLPPRKFDIYTIGLVGTAVYSANYLYKGRGGISPWEMIGSRISPSTQHQQQQQDSDGRVSGSVVGGIQKDLRGQREAWKMQRQREIREDVEEGKGFGDMIMDQVWEVWNWGKTAEEEEEGDEK